MYYAISAADDENGHIIGLQYKKDHRGRSWLKGEPFISSSEVPIFKQPPPTPVVVGIESGNDNHPFPSFLEEPIPLVRKDLFKILINSGVDNMDVYQVELQYSNGKLASIDYYAFNLIGKISAVDLNKSVCPTEQVNRKVNMQIDSLTVDESSTKEMLMFRLAENITTILVHEKVRMAVKESGIKLVRFFKPENIAIL